MEVRKPSIPNCNYWCSDNREKWLTTLDIRKRPILHPPIPSPYAGSDKPKIVYISTKTPFISALKRVQKLISLAEKRLTGKVNLVNGKGGTDRQKLKALDAAAAAPSRKQKESEAVILKATNMAIEKALNLAQFFQRQEGLSVQLRTGTVGVVDDIVDKNERGGIDEEEQGVERPDTQIRKISMLEVAIMLKWSTWIFSLLNVKKLEETLACFFSQSHYWFHF